MEKPFTKQIRYNSHLYRNRDRLMKAEQVEEIVSSGSANAQHVENVDDGIMHDTQLADNNLSYNDGEIDLSETLGNGEEVNNIADIDDDDDDQVVDYLVESSDEEQEAEQNEPCSVQDALRRWAITKNQTYESIEEVMEIIRRVSNCKLPKDARTLLKINRNPSTEILNIHGAQYWYHGVQKCLMNELSTVNIPTDSTLMLNVSIDGIPIFKSSNLQFWPILVNIHGMPEVPVMTVAIYSGPSKPASIEHFLRPFVDELNFLMRNGALVNNRKVKVEIRAVIADSPARAFIKGVISFNARNGCLKCTSEGKSIRGRMAYSECIASDRTDEGFRMRLYGDHHKFDSPLLHLDSFNMINQVIVSDLLHLVDLGITKRMLVSWILGKFGVRNKLSTTQINNMTAMLVNIKLPVEIHRKFRSFRDLKHWKGSEFASFLFYGSVVVLKEVLSEQQYKHFMLYFCSITLFTSEVYKEHWSLANSLLQVFVKQYQTIYGPEFISSNVHNLLHIYKEVAQFGPLHTISSYPFENELQHLKRLLRSGSKCLEQTINRITERETFHAKQNQKQVEYPFINLRGSITTLHVREGLCLKNDESNSWFLTKSGNVCKYVDSVLRDTVTDVFAKKLTRTENYFNYPFNFKFLNIHRGNINDLYERTIILAPRDIKCKFVLVPLAQENEYIFIPLIHTLVE